MDLPITTFKETFELKLNTDQHQIPICDLVEYLSNSDKLFRSINRTLNTKCTMGFDDIDVDVVAFQKGSFKIRFDIKKILSHNLTGVIVAVVLGQIIEALFAKEEKIVLVQNETDNVEIESEEFLKDRQTSNAIGNIARMVVESDNIKGISIAYEKSGGGMERININRSKLANVMYDEVDDSQSYITSNLRMEIISPVFLPEPLNWRVSLDGRRINAKMADLDFLEEMNNKKISFAKGDVIVADLETVLQKDETGKEKTRYCIIKVHSYPKYTRRLTSEERNLFNLGGE